MDLTPPSLTSSPASPQDKFIDSPCLSTSTLESLSEISAASYPSPDLLGFSYKPVSSFLDSRLLDSRASISESTQAWASPNTMASDPHSIPVTASLSNILPASDYDTFSSYDPTLAAAYPSGESYSAPPPQSALAQGLLRTPPPPRSASAVPSSSTFEHRGSFGYSQGHMLTASKLEAMQPYGQVMDNNHFSAASGPSLGFSSNDSSFGAAPSLFGDSHLSMWSRPDLRPSEISQSGPAAAATPLTAESSNARATRKTTARQQTRVPRKHTTREEANFQCMVKGCGKFFSRSYNFKSHMDTHDDKREYPFPCPIDGCTKKFVRKTDLQRHHQSVHMKERNHKCDYCARLFARKDTLRR